MKVTLINMFLLLAIHLSFGQSVKTISDKTATAQQWRAVFNRWGNWYPKEKKILGQNVNIHHTMVWGWLAPAQNRRYKKGADIRPLSPTGPQTLRTTSLVTLNTFSNTYKKQTDSLGQAAVSEIIQTSGLASQADYLWIFYYSHKLKEVINYTKDDVRNSYGLSSAQIAYLDETGILKWYDDELLRLQERLNTAHKVDMARGNRTLAFQRMLTEFRQLRSKWDQQVIWAEELTAQRNAQVKKKSAPLTSFSSWNNSDREIMKEIIKQSTNIIP